MKGIALNPMLTQRMAGYDDDDDLLFVINKKKKKQEEELRSLDVRRSSYLFE